MAPFAPFLSEHMYQNLRWCLPEQQREDSVHYFPYPSASDLQQPHDDIEEAMAPMRVVIELGRTAREKKKLPLKLPLRQLLVLHKSRKFLDNLNTSLSYVNSELNVQDVSLLSETAEFVQLTADPDRERLGKRLRSDFSAVADAISKLSQEQLAAFENEGKMTVRGHELTTEDVRVGRLFRGDTTRYEAAWDTKSGALVVLDTQMDDALRAQGTAREVVNRIQRLRKSASLTPEHAVRVQCVTTDAWLRSVLDSHRALVGELTGATQIMVVGEGDGMMMEDMGGASSSLAREELNVLGAPLSIAIYATVA